MKYCGKMTFTNKTEIKVYDYDAVPYGVVTVDGNAVKDVWFNGMTASQICDWVESEYGVEFQNIVVND